MARKNVDLVIRAKDEAASVLDQITKALEHFTNASKGVDGSADKTESSLGQLGAAIATLQKQLGGLEIAEKLGGELRKAEKELSRMEGAFDETTAEAKQMETQLARTGDSSARFAAKLKGATDALARQKTAIKTAKKDQRELSAAYNSAEAAQAKLSARQAKLPAQINAQSAALDKAKGRYADLAAKIEATTEPSRTLQQQFEASARSVDRTTGKLNKLETEYSEITGKLRAAGSAMILFGEQSSKATANVARQEGILKKIGTNLAALDGKSKAAAGANRKLATSFEAVNGSLAKQEQRIQKAEANYVDLAQSAGKADAALEKLAGASLGQLAKELTRQKRAALEAKREYVNLTKSTSELAAGMARVTTPTKTMVAAFERSKVAAGAAKKEYLAQRVALELMGREYRETGTDISSINGTQARFQAILARTTVELKKNAEAAAKAQANLDRLHGAGNRAAGTLGRVGNAAARTATATERGARSTSRMATAYRQFYGDSRRSLSLLQRIRGEVLSLVAAYAGLFGAIQVLKGTIDATQKLEAAQSRLGVAFGGDQSLATKELDFLRRTSDRLGLSFGALATEYSKFAIATQGTNLAGANTRKIFLAVAEAARVNRSSTSEMSGVFVALTQIVSKGAVQMEELRQQLGDRLPGAIKIMADGLGVGTAELIKMMEQGEVTADALVPFAEELTKKFGKGLPDALNSVSTAIGRLANEAFEALLRFGEAGFLDSFQKFATQLTATLQTADFQAFADRASRALGGLMDLLALAAENFNILLAVFAAFIGLKITPVFIAIAGSMKLAATSAGLSGAAFAAAGTQATVMGGAVSRATFAVRGLTVALRTLLSSTGLGLLVAAIGAGIAIWATSADDASESMNSHADILDQVKNAYDLIGDSVESWKNQLDTLTKTEAVANLRRISDALADTRDEFDLLAKGNNEFLTNFFGYNLSAGEEIFNVSDDYKSAVQGIIASYRAGNIAADDLVGRLDDVNQKYDDGSEEVSQFGEALIKMARRELEVAEAHEQANDILIARTGTAKDAGEAFDRLGDKIKETADPTKDFADAFEKLSAVSSSLVDDMPKVTTAAEDGAKAAQELADAYAEALKSARALPEAIQRAAAEQKVMTSYAEGMSAAITSAGARVVKDFDQFTDGLEASAAFIRSKEGFIGQAAFDVNADRVGFGSDTLTDRQGNVTSVQAGSTTTIEAANRDLLRRLSEEFIPAVVGAIGQERFDSLTAQQQAALASLAYNYGAGAFAPGEALAGIAEQVRSGTTEGVVAAIAARAGDNEGVNRGRRLEEAALFQSDAGVPFAITDIEERNQKEREFHDELQDEIETRRQEAALQTESLIKQEQGKAIREAELKAKREGTTLSQDERLAIEETVAAKFALKQEEIGIKDAKEAAALADAKVNALLAQRRALDKRLEIATEQGDTAKATELEERLVAVNTQLTQAIESAKAMWTAIGGDAATNAIIKLETAALRADTLELSAQKTYLQWDRVGDLFVGGLASAFDTFAQKVAEGENAGRAAAAAFTQFAADFLIQIAQMILKQAIFNALSSAFGGTGFGQLIGVGHTGGLVGSSRVGSGNGTRSVSPAMFAGAARYHSGGIIGLKPGEVPIIAQQGEEMLTRDDPRHMLNGGGGGQAAPAQRPMTIVNTFDPAEAFERALATPQGEEVFLNTVRARRTEIKAVLG